MAVGSLLLIAACSSRDAYDPEAERAKLLSQMQAESAFGQKLPPTSEGDAFDIPSDPQASYRLLTIKHLKNGHLEVMSRRDGPHDTGFERYELSCASQTYRSLGQGDTKEQAQKDREIEQKFTDLVSSSTEDYTMQFACRKAQE